MGKSSFCFTNRQETGNFVKDSEGSRRLQSLKVNKQLELISGRGGGGGGGGGGINMDMI